jgi:hypothetical protein
MRQAVEVGMFDEYEPVPPIPCPSCGGTPKVWQGKDGPSALLCWQQGIRRPVAQRADEPVDDGQLQAFALPDRFRLVAECPNGHVMEAEGTCSNGIWAQTRLFMA